MADSYAEGAAAVGHEVRRIEVAKLEFPLLRTQAEFETGMLPPALVQARDDMRWAEHWVCLFPLWHGTMPALFKGFLEQIFRPGFAMEYDRKGFPKRLLAGRSARIIMTMGMPVMLYRWYFGAFGLRGFERSMLSFAWNKTDSREPLRTRLLQTKRNVCAGLKRCGGTASKVTDAQPSSGCCISTFLTCHDVRQESVMRG